MMNIAQRASPGKMKINRGKTIVAVAKGHTMGWVGGEEGEGLMEGKKRRDGRGKGGGKRENEPPEPTLAPIRLAHRL